MNYDLSEKMDYFFGNTDNMEENIFVNDIKEHSYYDTDFMDNFDTKTSYMLSINVCSLMSKYNDLQNLISYLRTKECNILLIAIQETWDIKYPELVDIQKFKLVYKTRTATRGGGVAFYIRNDIQHKILTNLSYFEERVFECLTVELILNKKSVLSVIFINHLTLLMDLKLIIMTFLYHTLIHTCIILLNVTVTLMFLQILI